MKIEQKQTAPLPKEVVSHSGARVGDKIIFSSHHPKNIENTEWMAPYITFNKPYTIVEVSQSYHTVVTYVIDDTGDKNAWGGSDRRIGSYDIIERAPLAETPKPKFQPVHVILETPEEVKFIAELIGSTGGKRQGDFNTYEKIYTPLKEICNEQCGGYDSRMFTVQENTKAI